MTKYRVYVERRLYVTGTVYDVEASSDEEAGRIVEDRLMRGELQLSEVDWGDPVPEECSWDILWDETQEDDEEGGEA